MTDTPSTPGSQPFSYSGPLPDYLANDDLPDNIDRVLKNLRKKTARSRAGTDQGAPRTFQGTVDPSPPALRPPGISADRTAVGEFLRALSERAAFALKGVENPGVLQLFRLHPTAKAASPSRYVINDVDLMIEDAIAASDAGHNSYIEGRTVRSDLGQKRGKLEDTKWVFAIVIDSDADKSMAWAGSAQASVIVETSPGNKHYWFFLRNAITAAEGRALGDQVRASAGADRDTGTVTQPYRVAGTVNYPSFEKQKRGRTTTPTRLLDLTDRLWTPDELTAAFLPPGSKKNAGGDDRSRQHHDSFNEDAIPAKLMMLIREGTEEGGRSEQFFRVVAELKQLGWTSEAITRLLERYPNGIAAKYAGRIGPEVERVYRKIEEQRAVGEGVSLDDFHAYMPAHSYIFAPTGEMWPATSVNARIALVPALGADRKPLLDGNGKQKSVEATKWLDRNKPVEQMTWAPGLPSIIPNRLIAEGGWIDRAGVSCFNLYRPPVIEFGNAAEAVRWLDYIHKVYGDYGDHVVKFLAHRVQRPGEKINHALFLGGIPGIGKDTILEPVKHAVGPWNFAEVSPYHLMGRFNGFLKSNILRVSEARDLGEVNRYQFYEHMKAYTAAPPDVLRVDEKNLREYYVPNCCGVIITSNHKVDGIYLPPDDRRHFVAWSDLTQKDFTPNYWKNLWLWYEREGNRHVAAYLNELDISSFDPKAPPLKTPAFWEIVDASRAPEEAEEFCAGK
jgi:Family of unknown function (DUF5906)/RepB DNA-primase from phage plasmid